MSEINFASTPEEAALIRKIAKRAYSVIKARNGYIDRLCIEMDLTATHLNGMPLDLEKLYRFDDFNLLHDVIGIYNHLNRETGTIEKHFLPRCAKPDNN